MAQYSAVYSDYVYVNSYVPSDRLTVSSNVQLPGANYNFNGGGLMPDGQRRGRTQAKRIEREELEKEEKRNRESYKRETNKKGVRVSAMKSAILVAVLLLACTVVLVGKVGTVGDYQEKISRTRRSVTEYRTQNDSLRSQILAATDEAKICYYASQKLGMIPATSAAAIHLYAPSFSTMGAELAEAEPEVSVDQASVIASN